MSEQAAAQPAVPSAPGTRRLFLGVLRAAFTLAALAFMVHMVDGPALLAAFARISPRTWLLAMAVFMTGLWLGALRWRFALEAFGADQPPRVLQLFRAYLVGVFYSTWLPLGIGGDIVRALATRRAFATAGATGSLAVVFIERILGMVGLLLLAAGATLVRPLTGLQGMELLGLAGLFAAAGAIGGVLAARRIAPLLPLFLRRHVERIPAPVRYAPLAIVLALSVLCQAAVACGGHVLLMALAPQVPVSDSLVIIPAASAAAFLPLTVSGLGVREAAFVALYAKVGVAKADALAVSLAMFGCALVVALIGGLIELFAPLTDRLKR